MKEDEIVTLQTFHDPMLAHIVRTRLEDDGIPCFIADENMIGLNPLYNQTLGGIKLKVFKHDVERCRELLAKDESLPVEDHFEVDEEEHTLVACPYCASTNVRYGAATKNRFGWLTVLVSLILTVYPFHNRKAWHCFNCLQDFE